MLALWGARAHKAAQAHYIESELCRSKDKFLTVCNAVLSISVLFLASATWIEPILFNSVDDQQALGYKLLVSLFSLLVVLTTILHYLFRFEDRSNQHAKAAHLYGGLLKKIERYECSKFSDMDSLHIISKQYTSVTNAAPSIPRKRWKSKKLEPYTKPIEELESVSRQADLFESESPTATDPSTYETT